MLSLQGVPSVLLFLHVHCEHVPGCLLCGKPGTPNVACVGPGRLTQLSEALFGLAEGLLTACGLCRTAPSMSSNNLLNKRRHSLVPKPTTTCYSNVHHPPPASTSFTAICTNFH